MPLEHRCEACGLVLRILSRPAIDATDRDDQGAIYYACPRPQCDGYLAEHRAGLARTTGEAPRDWSVSGPAIYAYRSLVDPRCPDDDTALARILAALATAHKLDQPPRRDGATKWRANARHGRIQFVVGGRGDVINVLPATGALRQR